MTGIRPTKQVYIKTFGCQMNVYDSERMADALRQAGYGRTESPEDADLLLLNTCHIREKAVEKVYSELGRLRRQVEARRSSGARTLVGVTGCVAQAEGAEIPRRQPLVDLVIGPQAYHRLPQAIEALERDHGRQILVDFPAETKFARLPNRRSGHRPSAFLTVQEGCDKFCTFCVVPYTRGAEHSRPAAEICAEAEGLAAGGVAEITLLGQNVNAYRGAAAEGGEWNLAALLQALARIDGIKRLRYTTSHPRDMDDDLIAAHAENPKLMPCLHLPVQSGSDRILAAMNRNHDIRTYLDTIARIRAARPDIAITSDFIVGFPGETEEDFDATLDLVDRVGYAQAYSFCYSPRPGTPAASAPDQIPRAIASERLQRLQARLERQGMAFRKACIGHEIPVLLEKPGSHEGQMVGRSPHLLAVHCDAPKSLRGSIVPVRIEATTPNGLAGRIAA